MDNKIIKKFCKSNKNGIISKNRPEGLINYISFYKDIDSDELKPHVITFKKSLNKKNRYNLCKDNSCKEDEYVVKNLSIKKVKKLLKNIDDFSLANIRKQLDLENRVSGKIKYVKHSKKNKAKKFRQCRELTEKKESVINSKKILKKKSKKSTKKVSFDFRRLMPKSEKSEKPQKVIIREVIQQKPPTPNKKNNQEIEKLRKEQNELLQKIEELQIKQQQQQQSQQPQEQQLQNNNREQKYLEKIKSLEKNLQEVGSYGEKKSEAEKSLKQKIEKTKYEYETELKRQKQKLEEEKEKRRKLEYNRQYSKSKQGTYNSQLSQYKRELASRKAQENRLRRERNQYKQLAARSKQGRYVPIAKPVRAVPVVRARPVRAVPVAKPVGPVAVAKPVTFANEVSDVIGEPGGPSVIQKSVVNNNSNNANNAENNNSNTSEELIIGAFDIFVVDFKTINNTDVGAITSQLEMLKQNNSEKKVYLFNVPEILINEKSMKDYFFIEDMKKLDLKNDNNLENRLELLRKPGINHNYKKNYSSITNYSDSFIEFLLKKFNEDNGKRTLLICSNTNKHEDLISMFHTKIEYQNIDCILLKNNIDVLSTIKKKNLRKKINVEFKYVNKNYTYFDNDNSSYLPKLNTYN